MAEAKGQEPVRRTTPMLRIAGRVQQVTKRSGQNGDTYRTLIRTPAEDEFSSPGTWELRSKRRLGGEGQMIEVECELHGYARSYENKDGDTVRTAEIVAEVV